MAFPRGNEYNEAVQNPNISFTDLTLQRSQVETQMFGLPKPYAGGFTVTYKLLNASGNWAVRCFTRDVNDLQQRYQALSTFVNTNTALAPYFAEAAYVPTGIKVNGRSYPIIKMRWVEGDPLNLYLQKVYQQSSAVESILTNFVDLIQKMEAVGIAHGDLQHGNIVVSPNKMLLIDYDDIYLPGSPGLKANGAGHPNYQHPKRTEQNYGKTIDRFSAIVIYLGLKAIALKPALWSKYDNGENILIKSTDIADLSASALMQDLSIVPELKPLVDRFKGICYLPFDQVPTLTEFLKGSFTYNKSNTGTIAVIQSQYAVLDGRKKGSVLEHFGERVEIVGRIDAIRESLTRNGDPYAFLNIGVYPDQTFTVVIWSGGLEQLKEKDVNINSYRRQWISVVGVISSYNSVPQMTVETISQIQTLSSEQEALAKLSNKGVVPPTPNPVRTNATPRPPAQAVPIPKTIPPTPKAPTPTQGAEVFNTLYGNRPATPALIPQPAPRPAPQPQPVKAANVNQPAKSNPQPTLQKTQPAPSKKSFWDRLVDIFK